MNTVCEKGLCTGCMACIAACGKKAIHVEDGIFQMNAVIDQQKCVNCGACRKVCQQINPVALVRPISIVQGWVDDPQRQISSSGGFATEIARSFARNNGCVCSCIQNEEGFGFAMVESEEEVGRFSGSKYVKSNPIDAYHQVTEQLALGKDVLFIGLPCQVAGMKAFCPDKLQNKLYTIDLICHGTPSKKFLEMYLREKGHTLNENKRLTFRQKSFFGLHVEGSRTLTGQYYDEYSIAFLQDICHTENCYQCRYATTERCSDITLGDSWGSELPDEEQKKGISLALVQTEKGARMIAKSKLHLFEVDAQKAIAANHQLQHPSHRAAHRDEFVRYVEKHKRISGYIQLLYPKICLRQTAKKVLYLLRKKA